MGDNDLHRLNWELMRSDARFLAAPGPKLDVAITRIVATQFEDPEPLGVPPRVLFVVGTSLTEEKIRPGAELYSLLRNARAGRAMRYRLLERATPRQVRREVKDFHPEVVHLICHGGVEGDPPSVYLELQTDEVDLDPKRTAPQLLVDLSDGDWRPTIVVLSACLTAGEAGAPRYVLAGVHQSAPMAAALVQGGIPIVLGMAGRVADATSRLFARGFTQALLEGEPLVRATAVARQVAFAYGPDPEGNIDWAFPSIFMSDRVSAGYRPIDAAGTKALWEQIQSWLEFLDEEPVFCGREELLTRFHRLFENAGGGEAERRNRKRVLLALVASRALGYGRTRLLQEFAAQAFREGHIPLLLNFDGVDAPRTHEDLLTEIDRAISQLRLDVLGLSEADISQARLLLQRQQDGMEQEIRIELERSRGELTARAVRQAIAVDLRLLVTDARKKYEFFRTSNGQVVVLLDDVDRYGELVDRLLARKNGLLGPLGFGTKEQPVPVVMTCSRGDSTNDATLKAIDEQPQSIGWLAVEHLGPFERNGEDLLACQAVLLNPFSEDLLESVSNVPWAFDSEVAPDVRERWERGFRNGLKGLPVHFHTDRLYLLVDVAVGEGFIRAADDEDRLAKLPKRQ